MREENSSRLLQNFYEICSRLGSLFCLAGFNLKQKIQCLNDASSVPAFDFQLSWKCMISFVDFVCCNLCVFYLHKRGRSRMFLLDFIYYNRMRAKITQGNMCLRNIELPIQICPLYKKLCSYHIRTSQVYYDNHNILVSVLYSIRSIQAGVLQKYSGDETDG